MKPVQIDGFRGIVNTEPPERIRSLPGRDAPLVDLVDAVNVDIDDTGRISRRAGQTLVVPGAAHSLWSDGNACMYIHDGMMYALDRSFHAEAIAAGLDDLPMAYVSVGKRVYHANGRTSAVYENGYVRSWGIDLRYTDVAASATFGQLPAGVYLFAMTLIREDGQESGCGPARRIDLTDNAGITFTWEVPADLGITQAALYLTQADGETLFQAALVDVDAGIYTYTGGPRALPLATQWLDKPPAGSALALYRGRIYIAKGEHLFATAPLSYEHCDLRDFRAFDGTPVRVLAPVESGLFVGTARAVYFLSGANFADNAITRKLDVPAIPGTLASGDAGEILGNPQLAGQHAVVFTTRDGIVLGLPDGTLVNFTNDDYTLPEATTGAAVLRSGKAQQYVVSLDATVQIAPPDPTQDGF